jgi:transcriptional regulator GlxA family with amidase domain
MALSTPPKTIAFLLSPEFALLAFGSAVEPYRAANIAAGETLYQWRFLTDDGERVEAGNGLTVTPDGRPEMNDKFDRVFVCGGVNSQRYHPEHSIRWLQQQASAGTPIGGISTGTWTLAHAGLLAGRRCTIHWQSLDALREAFPDIVVDPAVYVVEENRFTCCGGTGALDLMVHLIAEDYGDELVTDVCTWLFHDRIRVSTDVQGVAQHTALARKSPKLAAAFRVMATHIEDRLTPGEISASIGVSQRQLERLFQRHLQCTPQQKYMDLRLQHARRLLLETSLPILDISIAAGFTSQSHFTKCYREKFHRTPRSERVGPRSVQQ